MKIYHTTNFGDVTLSQLNENTFEVYDATEDIYRGCIVLDPWNLSDKTISDALDKLYAKDEESIKQN